jgi:5'-nucleotidase
MTAAKPLILLTNDDGYFSPGIEALETSLRKFAETYIVAPDRERSGNSLSLTLRRPLRVQKIRTRVFAADGTPADCVYLALKTILPRRPDLLLSGMNLGSNLGQQDISYSGTVAAALQGTYLEIPAAAISLLRDGRGLFDVETGARFAVEIARRLLRRKPRPGLTLNINIPPGPLKGVRITSLGLNKYDPEIIPKKDPRGDLYYWIGAGAPRMSGGATSDVRAVKEGFISITPLHTDLTDYPAMNRREMSGLCGSFRAVRTGRASGRGSSGDA